MPSASGVLVSCPSGQKDEEAEAASREVEAEDEAREAGTAPLARQPRLRTVIPGKAWRVVCIGDSLTCEPSPHGYPTHLQQCLNGDATRGPWEVKDSGVRGTAVVAAAGFPAYRRLPRMTSHLSEPPDVFVVMLGTNDARKGSWSEGTFVDEYVIFLRQLQGPGPDRPVLVLAPPRAGSNAWGIDPTIAEAALQEAVGRAAGTLDLPLLDSREAINNAHLGDGVHLNAAGAQALARLVCKALQGLVNS